MNNSFSKGVLTLILFFALLLLSISVVFGFGGMVPQIISDFSFTKLFGVILNLIYFLNYAIVAKYLLNLIKTTETTPFIIENVKRFRIMGYCLMYNSIFECIMGYSGNNVGNIQILATSNGAITVPMIICFLSALMCFVMGEIFDKAIKIKHENDLTI